MHIFPEDVSTYGPEIDKLFWLILFFASIAFFVSLFAIIYPLFRYRQAKSPKAQYITGEKKKHFKWILIALVLFLGSDLVILFVEHDAWGQIEEVPAKADVHVGIIARQWNWIFVYPGPDGKLNTPDDVRVDEMNSSLHIPVNKNIVFELRSQDVIHSFFLPDARLKQDALPGRTVIRWFNITKPGKYDIACTQICGILHYQMRNFVVAEPEEQYKRYIDSLYKANSGKTAMSN